MTGPPSSRGNRPEGRELAWDRYWSEAYRPGNEHPGAFTRWAAGFLRASGARSVLDLGCGPGRDMTFLLEQGFAVTGVDGSRVATHLAERAVARLPEPAATRGRVVHADVLEYVTRLDGDSVDAVHAAATYQGFSDRELRDLFDGIYRILRARGLHLWLVRGTHHAGRATPGSVPPNFPALGFTVPLRFFELEQIRRLGGHRFELLDLFETPDLHSFYVAERKRESGAPPLRPSR